jgi:multiple antibiotic resistance protein
LQELFITAFVTLLVVIDPIGVAAIFAALTHRETDRYRVRTAIKGTTIAGAVLLLFTLIGDPLLAMLGISLSAFRIAGGVLLFLLSIDMVLARDSGLRSTTLRETEEAATREDISVFPLAIPLIGGPGAITSMLLLTGQTRGEAGAVVVVIGVMVLVLALTLGALLMASRIMRVIGVTGAGVVSRVLGILLAALAVQFMIDGLRASLV